MATASALISANTVVPKPCSRADRYGTRVTRVRSPASKRTVRPATSASSSRTCTRVPGRQALALAAPADGEAVEDDGALAVLGVDDDGGEDLRPRARAAATPRWRR